MRRRVIGALFLLASVGMLVAGVTVLAERLRVHPAVFLVFWMICVLLLGMAVFVAVLDLAVIRRRLHDEQLDLLERTVRQISEKKNAQSPGQSRSREGSK